MEEDIACPLLHKGFRLASFSERIVTSGFCGGDQGLQTALSQCLDFLSLLNESGSFVQRRYIALSNREGDHLSQQCRLFHSSISSFPLSV